MARQMHLTKSGTGLSMRTACGRNVVRTPMSCGWEGFKLTPDDQQCEKCATSRHAAFSTKRDADKWIPESPDAWMLADDKLIRRQA